MLKMNAEDLWNLLKTESLPLLGPQKRSEALAHEVLSEKIAPEHLPVFATEEQRDILRGVILLWHDDLESAHAVAQALEGDQDADLLHAILHRRESDYFNAKYWSRQVGKHACYINLAQETAIRLRDYPVWRNQLLPKGEWDGSVFVDLCAEVAKRNPQEPDYRVLQELQGIEIQEFLKYLMTGLK